MLNASARKARQKSPPNRWPVRSALVVFFTAAALVAAMGALSSTDGRFRSAVGNRVLDHKKRYSDNRHHFLAQSQRLSSLPFGQRDGSDKRRSHEQLHG